MTTQFDFSSIADLGTFWDGSKSKSGWGGGTFDNRQGNNVDLLYQNLLGRNADPSGRKYWGDKLASGENTYETLANTIKASQEYQDQQSAIAEGATANQLKMLDSAYVSPFNAYSGSAAAGWTPDQPMTLAHARAAATTESNPDGSQKLDADGNYIPKSSYSDQTNKNFGDVLTSLGISGGVGGGGAGVGSMNYTPYDDSGLRDLIGGLTGQLGDLRSAFDAYKTQSAKDMQNVWNNANWGWGQEVGGVRTQNELPGWAPKKGGTSGFFGRGGRSGKGLTTSSLNI
tara:strand:- start:40 stop:897 length:858 start_codon:yes stop_codon:yes gene_type:complete